MSCVLCAAEVAVYSTPELEFLKNLWGLGTD
jgi:hypothetical protein